MMRCACSLLLFFALVNSFAQVRWVQAEADQPLPKRWRGVTKVNGPLGPKVWAQNLREDLVAHGWLEANCDTLHRHIGDTVTCVLHFGQRYRLGPAGRSAMLRPRSHRPPISARNSMPNDRSPPVSWPACSKACWTIANRTATPSPWSAGQHRGPSAGGLYAVVRLDQGQIDAHRQHRGAKEMPA